MDIGFQEIALITVIGLVVIGPERLPKVARTIGLYMGRLRRMVSEVRADVEQQLHAAEFKQEFKESGAMDEIQELARETQNSYEQARDSLMATSGSVEAAVEETKQEVQGVPPAMESELGSSDGIINAVKRQDGAAEDVAVEGATTDGAAVLDEPADSIEGHSIGAHSIGAAATGSDSCGVNPADLNPEIGPGPSSEQQQLSTDAQVAQTQTSGAQRVG
ncbi:MAG: twin-arginine translocase subunit TatB [Gammaproteobacteria bacterium]|nr:twin-arginine translocase subunit TatB [Gammaproteobacteria bacterium]